MWCGQPDTCKVITGSHDLLCKQEEEKRSGEGGVANCFMVENGRYTTSMHWCPEPWICGDFSPLQSKTCSIWFALVVLKQLALTLFGNDVWWKKSSRAQMYRGPRCQAYKYDVSTRHIQEAWCKMHMNICCPNPLNPIHIPWGDAWLPFFPCNIFCFLSCQQCVPSRMLWWMGTNCVERRRLVNVPSEYTLQRACWECSNGRQKDWKKP